MIKGYNVFVDAGVAFIVDLEYITEMGTVMLKPFRAISQVNQPDFMTAEELDYK